MRIHEIIFRNNHPAEQNHPDPHRHFPTYPYDNDLSKIWPPARHTREKQIEAIKKFVAAGNGVALLPLITVYEEVRRGEGVARHRPGIRVRPLEGSLQGGLNFLVNAHVQIAPLLL